MQKNKRKIVKASNVPNRYKPDDLLVVEKIEGDPATYLKNMARNEAEASVALDRGKLHTFSEEDVPKPSGLPTDAEIQDYLEKKGEEDPDGSLHEHYREVVRHFFERGRQSIPAQAWTEEDVEKVAKALFNITPLQIEYSQLKDKSSWQKQARTLLSSLPSRQPVRKAREKDCCCEGTICHTHLLEFAKRHCPQTMAGMPVIRYYRKATKEQVEKLAECMYSARNRHSGKGDIDAETWIEEARAALKAAGIEVEE